MVHKICIVDFRFSFFILFFSITVCISSMFHINPQLILPTNFSLIQLGYCLGVHLFNNLDRNIFISTTLPLLSIIVAQAPIVSLNLLLMSTMPLIYFVSSPHNALHIFCNWPDKSQICCHK